MEYIGLLFYYIFGVVGAWLGLVTLVYILYSYKQIRKLHRKNKNRTQFDNLVCRLYDHIGLDFEKDDFVTSKIGIDVVLICGLYATLGTCAFLITFLLTLVSYFTVTLIHLINK